jgi:hypothetical protein
MRALKSFKFKMNLAKSEWNFGRIVDRIRNKFYNQTTLGSYSGRTFGIEVYLKEHGSLYKDEEQMQERIINTIEHEAIHHCLRTINPNINTEYHVKYIQRTLELPNRLPERVLGQLMELMLLEKEIQRLIK